MLKLTDIAIAEEVDLLKMSDTPYPYLTDRDKVLLHIMDQRHLQSVGYTIKELKSCPAYGGFLLFNQEIANQLISELVLLGYLTEYKFEAGGKKDDIYRIEKDTFYQTYKKRLMKESNI